jgi:hypothetical protein
MITEPQTNPDAKKRAEQLERSREWLKRYHEARKTRAIAPPIEDAAE